MFKKITDFKEVMSSVNFMGNSDIKNTKKELKKNYPEISKMVDILFNKKNKVQIVNCKQKLKVVTVGKNFLFFRIHKDPLIPVLKILHKYPFLLKRVDVDRGAVPHILRGADIMMRGLTGEGSAMDDELEKGDYCAVHVEGKEHAIAIGKMLYSANEIKEINEGIGIEIITKISDAFYRTEHI